jgi:hypothetical protein
VCPDWREVCSFCFRARVTAHKNQIDFDIYKVYTDRGTVLEFHGVKVRINPRDHLPPHVHVVGNGCRARFNISTMEWMESLGFTRSDLKAIEEVIWSRIDEIWLEWNRCHEKK